MFNSTNLNGAYTQENCAYVLAACSEAKETNSSDVHLLKGGYVMPQHAFFGVFL